MAEQRMKVRDKKVQKMTKDGLVEENLTDKDVYKRQVEYLKCVFPSIVVEKIREKKKGQKNSYRCRT